MCSPCQSSNYIPASTSHVIVPTHTGHLSAPTAIPLLTPTAIFAPTIPVGNTTCGTIATNCKCLSTKLQTFMDCNGHCHRGYKIKCQKGCRCSCHGAFCDDCCGPCTGNCQYEIVIKRKRRKCCNRCGNNNCKGNCGTKSCPVGYCVNADGCACRLCGVVGCEGQCHKRKCDRCHKRGCGGKCCTQLYEARYGYVV